MIGRDEGQAERFEDLFETVAERIDELDPISADGQADVALAP